MGPRKSSGLNWERAALGGSPKKGYWKRSVQRQINLMNVELGSENHPAAWYRHPREM